MTEDIAAPTVPDAPITTDASPALNIAQSVGAAILLVAGAVPALVAVLGTHDVIKIVAYVSGAGFAPALGALTVIATAGYRIFSGWKRHTNMVKLLRLPGVPNAVGFVKGDPGTPGAVATPIPPAKAG